MGTRRRAALLFLTHYLARLDDETVGGGAHVVEGVARYQGQLARGPGFQYAHLAGLDDFRALHAIGVFSRARLKEDQVVLADVAQAAEDRIAVAGHSHVALLTRERRTGDVTEGQAQGILAVAFGHHGAEAEPWYGQPTQKTSAMIHYRRNAFARRQVRADF